MYLFYLANFNRYRENWPKRSKDHLVIRRFLRRRNVVYIDRNFDGTVYYHLGQLLWKLSIKSISKLSNRLELFYAELYQIEDSAFFKCWCKATSEATSNEKITLIRLEQLVLY